MLCACCDDKTVEGGRWEEGHQAERQSSVGHLDQFILQMEVTAFTWQQEGNIYH